METAKIIPTGQKIKEHLRHTRQEIAKLEAEIRAEQESAKKNNREMSTQYQ